MKSLKLLALIIICTAAFQMSAQEYLDFNTGADKQKRILLVPFDPRIYLNDATGIIAARDGDTHDEIMEYFRYQFNLQLYNALMDSCIITSLYTDNTRQDQNDIDSLYSVISYELVAAMENRPENPDDIEKKGFFERKREEKARDQRLDEMSRYNTKITNGELDGHRQRTDDMYLNIIFHDPSVLKEIAKRRNIDYFLFINHFEIKGNYGDPYMSGNSGAARTLKVHFSIFNMNGELIHGSYGQTTIPFKLDNKEEITALYFPEVIRQIIHNIDF